ncbi:hypothetical protein C1646_759276 [Rhizophagus diaphanus]|nr:hypothetical protein C1646_759276 [Rhizophagus diaphanus] [Rhizophagus sp. MUCL 43196]
MVHTKDKKDKNNNNNKTKDFSNKRSAQSPSQETSSQSLSTFTITSQPLAAFSAKRTKVSDSETTMNIDNILPPSAFQKTTSSPPVNTNTSPSMPASGISFDDSQHSSSNSVDKGKSVEITPPEQEHAASLDVSNTAIQSSPVRYYAAAVPHTIENFWTHYKTNHKACDVVDRIFAKYSSYVSKTTCQGSGDLKRIHDPSAKKADEQLRIIVVTDIPLFVTDAQLRVPFLDMASLLITAHIFLNYTTPRAHIALLASLFHGTIAADLVKITKEISAKTANISFSMNLYNLKPYAYLYFSSAEAKESAMAISYALKSVGLTWHEPDEVSSLCHCYDRYGCNPNACGSSHSIKHPSRSWV